MAVTAIAPGNLRSNLQQPAAPRALALDWKSPHPHEEHRKGMIHV